MSYDGTEAEARGPQSLHTDGRAAAAASTSQPEGIHVRQLRRRRRPGPLLMMQHPQHPQHPPLQEPETASKAVLRPDVAAVGGEGSSDAEVYYPHPPPPSGGDLGPSPLIDPEWTAALLESSRFKLARFTAQVRRHSYSDVWALLSHLYLNFNLCCCPMVLIKSCYFKSSNVTYCNLDRSDILHT